MIFNQRILLRTVLDVDKFGKYRFNEIEIKCRLDFRELILQNNNGAIVQCIAKISTYHKCNEGDKIFYDNNEYTIVAQNHSTDITGNIKFYTYYISRSQGVK